MSTLRETILAALHARRSALPERLDLARDAERVRDSVPGLIVAKWLDDP